jgi:ribonuclease J
MNIKFHTLGGYNEVGRNMSCLEIGNEAVILDMGIYLDRYIPLQDNINSFSTDQLIKEDALPNDQAISHLRKKVKAIVISHAHYDHMGAIPWLASHYDCPIFSTPYTIELLKHRKNEQKYTYPNKFISINLNATYKLSKNITIELINTTHSIVQASMVNISTPQGHILYALDYKFDNHPIVGKTTNKKRLRELGKSHTLALIVDSTNAEAEKKTYSESVAREMLKDVLLGGETGERGIIVTTFSSHVARLKTIYDIGTTLGRKIVFIGRSLHDYLKTAEELGIIHFTKQAELIRNTTRAQKRLKEIHQHREDYVIVATGGQGEPNAALTKMAQEDLPLTLQGDDLVIFSCGVIPTPTIQAHRKILEHKLHNQKTRIFKDIHVSGHASREDIRDLISIISPQILIPAHGDMHKLASVASLGSEMGYSLGRDTHILQNGQQVTLGIG